MTMMSGTDDNISKKLATDYQLLSHNTALKDIVPLSLTYYNTNPSARFSALHE